MFNVPPLRKIFGSPFIQPSLEGGVGGAGFIAPAFFEFRVGVVWVFRPVGLVGCVLPYDMPIARSTRHPVASVQLWRGWCEGVFKNTSQMRAAAWSTYLGAPHAHRSLWVFVGDCCYT